MPRYKNAKYGLELDYPSGWLQQELPGVLVAFAERPPTPQDQMPPSFNVIVQDYRNEKTMSLDDFTAMSMQQMSEILPDLKNPELEEIKLSGLRGIRAQYQTDATPMGRMKFLQYWTLHENMAYIFTFSALAAPFDKYRDRIDSSIRAVVLNVAQLSAALEDDALSPDASLLLVAVAGPGWACYVPEAWPRVQDAERPPTYRLHAEVHGKPVDLAFRVATQAAPSLAHHTQQAQHHIAKISTDLVTTSRVVAGLPATMVTFTSPYYEPDKAHAIVYVVHNETAFNLTFSASQKAYPKMLPVFDRLVASFGFKSLPPLTRYENLDHRFTFLVPPNFVRQDLPMMTVSLTKNPEDPVSPTINIIAKPAQGELTLEQFGEVLQQQLDLSLHGKGSALRPCRIAGEPGMEFYYDGAAPQVGGVRFLQRYLLRPTGAVVISFSASSSSFESEFKHVDSFLTSFNFF